MTAASTHPTIIAPPVAVGEETDGPPQFARPSPTQLTIRCSSLDRVMACSGSLLPIDAPYAPQTASAAEGTAAHQALAVVVAGADPDLDAIATNHHVDRDDLAALVARGREAWAMVSRHFADPVPERLMATDLTPAVTIRGTADVVSIDDGDIAVLDWKCGWKPSENPCQLQGYAFLAASLSGKIKSITAIEAWLRAGTMRVHKWAEEDTCSFAERVLAQVKCAGKQWGPSHEACRYCPRQNACQARDEWSRSAVSALAPLAAETPVTRELIGELYGQSKQLAAALRRYNSALIEHLLDGPIPLPGSGQLVLHEQEQDSILPAAAMPVLRDEMRLSPMEANAVLRISKSGLRNVVKARARKGQAASAMREIMSRLRKAGAIETTIKTTVEVAAVEGDTK